MCVRVAVIKMERGPVESSCASRRDTSYSLECGVSAVARDHVSGSNRWLHESVADELGGGMM